jgi:beta-mannosidase
VTLSKSTTPSIGPAGSPAVPGQVPIDEPSFEVYRAEQPFAISNPTTHTPLPLTITTNADIETPSPIFVDETSIDIYKAGQTYAIPASQTAEWVVNVTIGLRTAANIPPSFLTLSFPELNLISSPYFVSHIPLSTQRTVWISVTWLIPDDIPQRWYPHNLGTPKLYDLSVSLDLPVPRSGGSGAPPPLFNFTTRTGFRTIELVQTPYPQIDVQHRGITPGDQWHFEINGRAFYSKGTNIIPFDPFYARVTTEKARWILESAVRSGQNMVRAFHPHFAI